jgi:hypothetical protein
VYLVGSGVHDPGVPGPGPEIGHDHVSHVQAAAFHLQVGPDLLGLARHRARDDNWRVWSHHTLTHNWKEVCDYDHGDYNYRAAVEALQSNGSWGPPIYSPVKNAHCGPSA